jgi:hypothetical protein
MKANFASSILLAAGFVAAVPARAEAQSTTLGSTPATSSSASLRDINSPSMAPYGSPAAPKRFGWAGVGFYDADGNGFFGFNAGGALDVVSAAPDLPLSVFGNVGLAFGNFVILPITVGVALHYDRLPVSLLGGLGLTLVPHTGDGGTPIGVGIIGMASYPLPQVRPGLSAMAQFQYHFLDDGFSLFVFDVGASMGF